jgi:thiol-disulfide isomerase/thioredoxin
MDRLTRWSLVLVALLLGCRTPPMSRGGEDVPHAGKAGPGASKPAGTMAKRFAAIRGEYDAAAKKAEVEAEKGKTEAESRKIYVGLLPDEASFSRRMVELAAAHPEDPAARDALLWVIDKPGMGPGGPYGDEFMKAVLILMRHHSDDPETARVGLELGNILTPSRDLFLEGLYVRANGHESKGLARLSLAGYLKAKAGLAAALRNAKGPLQTKGRFQIKDDDGKSVEKEFDIPPEQLAYHGLARMCDPEAIDAEARRLFEELIKDFGDVPHVTRRYKQLEAILKQPTPTWNGKPLTPEERKQAEQILAHKKSLADVARERLDEMDNLVPGKPAPAIDGVGMDGKSLKLSDYRGKVVLLVFWGTWCGPCMAEVPSERALAERLKGKPFAILGVDCDPDKAAALRVMKAKAITWPNWNDGAPGEGPIVERYHVRGFPTTFVIDAQGLIRHVNPHGEGLDKVVDGMIKDMENR